MKDAGSSSASCTTGAPHMSMGECGGLNYVLPGFSNSSGKTEQHKLPNLSTSQVFSPVDLVNQISSSFLSSHTGLAHFARASLHPNMSSPREPTCNVKEGSKPSLWPVPPPRWRWSGSSHLGARRRRRRRYHVARHRLLQLVVIGLNWECLGHPIWPPQHACLDFHMTDAQHQVVERLNDMVAHFLHAPAFPASELGRASEKFQDVISMVEELPLLGFEDLENLLQEIKLGLDPYSRQFCKGSSQKNDVEKAAQSHSFAGTEVRADLKGSRPVVADRIKWMYPQRLKPVSSLQTP